VFMFSSLWSLTGEVIPLLGLRERYSSLGQVHYA
jgi:hypothetical protein